MLAHLEYKEMFENTDCKLTAPGFQETGSGYWIEGITKRGWDPSFGVPAS